MEQTGKPERRQGKQGVADVSIIVPVYGVERFLRASVESMRAQTHRQIEILLVEDG
ncbi:MAG TPA: glycosyltransferase, partial [Candidatus Ventricola intestinavium]|nr:glycosyltransferase [Candidatus Ventricola intestinavium]